MLQNYIFSGNPAILFNKHPDLFSETSFHVPPSIIKKTANLLKVSGNFFKGGRGDSHLTITCK